MRNTICFSMFVLVFLFIFKMYPEKSGMDIESCLPRMIDVQNGKEACVSSINKASTGTGSSIPGRASSFRISDKAVSIQLWDIFLKDTGYFQSNHINSYYGNIYQYVKDDFSPVIFVSWNEAVFFCNWLSQKQGLVPVYQISGRPSRDDRNINVVMTQGANGYRLPFESEWEYVATEYGNKDKVVYDISKFYNANNSEKIANDKSIYRNKSGMLLYATKLYNVSEWVFDDFSSDNPIGSANQTKHKKVIRQISTRDGYTLDYRAPAIPYGEAGLVTFRLAQTVIEK